MIKVIWLLVLVWMLIFSMILCILLLICVVLMLNCMLIVGGVWFWYMVGVFGFLNDRFLMYCEIRLVVGVVLVLLVSGCFGVIVLLFWLFMICGFFVYWNWVGD